MSWPEATWEEISTVRAGTEQGPRVPSREVCPAGPGTVTSEAQEG